MKSFNLSDWALGHRSLVWYFMLAFMAAGLFSYLQLGRQEDPDFTIKTIQRLRGSSHCIGKLTQLIAPRMFVLARVSSLRRGGWLPLLELARAPTTTHAARPNSSSCSDFSSRDTK
jgi:hypothetical protein